MVSPGPAFGLKTLLEWTAGVMVTVTSPSAIMSKAANKPMTFINTFSPG